MTIHKILPILVISLLAGCSIFGGDKKEAVETPAALTALPPNAVKSRILWRAGAGQVSKKDYYGLQLGMDTRYLYAADATGRVTAFDLASGKSAWQVQTQPRLAAGVGLSDSAALVGTLDGEVVAVSRDSGSVLWRTAVSSEVLTSPSGDAEMVVVRSGDGRLHGLSAADGQRRWAFDRAVPTLSLRGASQPIVAGDRVYAGLDSGKLVALDLANGQLLWEAVVSAPSGRSEIDRLVDLDADPVLVGDTLYAVSYGGQVVALDAATGSLQWRQELSSYSGLSVDDERVYATDRSGRVWALDRSNGAVLWQQEELKHRQLTRPVVHGGLVAVGDYEGYIHWLSPEDGALRGRANAGRSALVASPLSDGSRLYILGRSGDITALELAGSG
jgi:outer membrane protein assembly factor BamB